MIEIILFFIFIVLVLLRPRVFPYFVLIYFFAQGILGAYYFQDVKVTFGHINVFPIDLMNLIATIYCLLYFVKLATNYEFNKQNCKATKSIALVYLGFILFLVPKFFMGYVDGLAFDSVIRAFISSTQILYFYIPLIIFNNIKQLKRLLYFTVILALIFPLCQPFLIHSEGTQYILKGQGTFRLGYGDANVLLAVGALALFSFEYKKYLTFLPLSGIMMLAHRSGYIAIVLAFLALSFLQGKKFKTMLIMGVSAVLMIGMLYAVQSFTNINILEKNIGRAEQTFENTGTTKARLGTIPIIFEEFLKRPFTGLGLKEANEMTKKSNDAHFFNIMHTHNFILSSIVATGLIGTIFLFTLIIKSWRAAYKLARSSEFKAAGVFLFSYLVFFIVYSVMNTTLESSGYILWFTSGITFWLLNAYEKTKEQVKLSMVSP